MICNYHSEIPLNKTRTKRFLETFRFFTCFSVKKEICLIYQRFFLSEQFLIILSLRINLLHIKRHFEVWDILLKWPDFCFFKCVFSHVWSCVGYSVYSDIHIFFSHSCIFKNYNHYVWSQMAKNCGTICLNMGKSLSWAFWLIAVICCVCVTGECIAIILTETTQQKHGPL